MPLGKFTVIALADGNFDMPAPKLLHEDKPGIVKSLLGKAGYTDTVPTSINGFLIDTGNKRVLIDTGTGGALAPTTGKLLDHLRAAGYEPAQIDEILIRSEEHTSELQSLMRISYAVFCLKKKHNPHNKYTHEFT